MRRKEVVRRFIKTFSEFLYNNDYHLYKNCFIKYQDGVFNRVSVWTRKTMDTVSLDIIHFCKPIYEDFVSIEDENENDGFSLAQCAFADDRLNEIFWSFEFGNIDGMNTTMQTVFTVYKDYFVQFDSKSIDDYNANFFEYNQKLNRNKETDPDEFISELFAGEVSVNSLPKDNKKKIDELLISARYTSYYIVQRLNELSQYKSCKEIVDELNLTLESVNDFNEEIENLRALCYNDQDYLEAIQKQEDAERNRIIENNKTLLLNAGIIV